MEHSNNAVPQGVFDELVGLAEKNDWDRFRALLFRNPEIARYQDEFQSTLLIKIINSAGVAVIEQLVSFGADINHVDGEGVSAIHLLISKKKDEDLSKIKFLLGHGADIELIGYNGWRPLHLAAYRNACNAANLFLEHGAGINARTESTGRKTPLMVAASANNLKMVKLLLEKGADINLKDKFGRTAEEYGRTIFGWMIKRYFEKYQQTEGS